MKKSVILLIAIVYLASVMIVGLLGIEMRAWEEYVYVQKISYVTKSAINTEKSNENVTAYKRLRLLRLVNLNSVAVIPLTFILQNVIKVFLSLSNLNLPLRPMPLLLLRKNRGRIFSHITVQVSRLKEQVSK